VSDRSGKKGRRAYYDTSVTPSWNDLRERDKRTFLSFIAEPDENGCSAWHGQMRAGYPDWERVDHDTRTQFRALARRLLAQSHGVELSSLDQVVASCENPGCMAWGHLSINRLMRQEITEEEKRTALEMASARTPQCGKHSAPRFRACFKRQRSGNVTAFFKCIDCEMNRRSEKNQMGRSFKEKRRDF
jgi:hypothetical protein